MHAFRCHLKKFVAAICVPSWSVVISYVGGCSLCLMSSSLIKKSLREEPSQCMLWLMSNIHCIVATRTEDLSLSLLLLLFRVSSSRFFTNSATLLCQDCWSPAGPLFSFSFFWTCQQGLGSGTLNKRDDTMASLVHGCLSFVMCFWAMF